MLRQQYMAGYGRLSVTQMAKLLADQAAANRRKDAFHKRLREISAIDDARAHSVASLRMRFASAVKYADCTLDRIRFALSKGLTDERDARY